MTGAPGGELNRPMERIYRFHHHGCFAKEKRAFRRCASPIFSIAARPSELTGFDVFQIRAGARECAPYLYVLATNLRHSISFLRHIERLENF
jgi:hypothetical protein